MGKIEFDAEVVKVTNLRDGAVRVTIDLPEGEITKSVQLLALATRKPLVRVTVETQG